MSLIEKWSRRIVLTGMFGGMALWLLLWSTTYSESLASSM